MQWRRGFRLAAKMAAESAETTEKKEPCSPVVSAWTASIGEYKTFWRPATVVRCFHPLFDVQFHTGEIGKRHMNQLRTRMYIHILFRQSRMTLKTTVHCPFLKRRCRLPASAVGPDSRGAVKPTRRHLCRRRVPAHLAADVLLCHSPWPGGLRIGLRERRRHHLLLAPTRRRTPSDRRRRTVVSCLRS